jgi:mannose/fructose/N-acetylgalactosamine-specific phosphotransferase system component IIC
VVETKRRQFIKILQIAIIVISIGMLYLTFGIYLNSAVNEKFEVASQTDIERVYLFSKIFMVYLVFVIIVLTISIFQKSKK